jgi:single-stranded DNA-specific DHH superfamily exonuclease
MKYLFKNKNYNIENPELVLHELLQDRGINEPERWLHTDETYEHSPLLLSGMKKATAMLNATLKNKEASILIVVDSDLDGYTSSAIILNLLRQVASGQDINYVIQFLTRRLY